MRRLFTASRPRLALSVAGTGPLVVFLHGMGGDRTLWHDALQRLADAFTAVSVDLRGYGDSEAAPGPLDFRQDFAADVLAVLDAFGAARAHVVGLSMGGRVARWAALLHPERIASLTLVNSSPGFDALDTQQVADFIARRGFTPCGDALPAGYGEQQARAMTAPGTAPGQLAAAAAPMQRLSATHYLGVLRASTEQDRGARLEDIACPVHVITSDRDPVYPQVLATQMLERLRDAQLTTIAQAGHLTPIEQPDHFADALRGFLLRQTPQPTAHWQLT